jgi:hypothetical protein
MAVSTNGINSTGLNIHFQRNEKDYDLWKLNDSMLAIYHKGIQGKEINIDLKDHTIVMFSPLKSEEDISIKGKSVIVLKEIQSLTGKTSIQAANTYIRIGQVLKSGLGSTGKGEVAAVYIPHPDQDCLNVINEELTEGIAQRNGDKILNGLIHVVAMAREYSNSDFQEDSIQAFLEYLDISSKV